MLVTTQRRLTGAALIGALALSGCAGQKTSAVAQDGQPVGPYKEFSGIIKLDVRDSKADWGPFTPKKAPEGAPNILFILYDDTGLAAFYVVAGIAVLAVSLITNYQYSPKREWAPATSTATPKTA